MSSPEKFGHLRLSLETIRRATHNFSNKNLIGEGGFGKVYEGDLYLSWKPTKIAARRLHYDYGQGDLEFWNEISLLDTLKHDNLVSFIGFCDEKGEKVIIHKHEVNTSLDKYLSSSNLTWMQRLQICVDVARALNYIHCDDGHESSVIHRNIKSSKILLDENWKPKLSGFELSKTNTKAGKHRFVLADIVGTIGYVDPTYEKTGFVCHKSDVYSFGVVLFEVLCSRRAFVCDETELHTPQYFTKQAYKDHKFDVTENLDDLIAIPHLNVGPPSYDMLKDYLGSFSLPNFERTASFDHKGQSSPVSGQTSFVDRPPSSFGGASQVLSGVELNSMFSMPSSGDNKHTYEQTPTENSYFLKDQRFRLHPLFTMKRLDQYLHSPNEELLAQLAKSHYEEDNLDDIIDPDLRKQMDTKSFRLFSETAYNCLKDKRAERPDIDQILRNLNKALNLQISYENPVESIVAGEVDVPTSNRWKVGNLEHLKIPLNDIEVATNNFTENCLGEGAFAKVYRAELEVPIEEKTTGEFTRKWRTVAIKRIKEVKRGRDGFHTEIELLTSCKHNNIVALLGFCDEGPNMILVYEHASNRSLDSYLGGTHSSTNLTWVQRIKICIDVAHGLDHIHNLAEDESRRIIHRDIKSENILLAKNWVAKIADFGLSRFHHADKKENTVYTEQIAGTECYVCPIYKKEGKLKSAVDIYSFGVVLFEILSGKLAYDQSYRVENTNGIAYVARRRFKDGTIHEMIDPKIMEEVDELTSTLHRGPNQDSLKTYIEIAYRCVSMTQDHRPSAKYILEELKQALYLQENSKDSLQMSFEEIKVATQNFSRENRIGVGGFGNVFKGEVTHGNETTTIAAKRLDRNRFQGENQFLMELEILFEYKHQNIIGLEGYCNEDDEKIIVYEYASNTSLDRYLNDVSLTWTKRLNICIDIAHGLAFLHGGASTKEMVIHRDIKSANILLNGDWKAKISDFGLSTITAINQQVVSNLVGTDGYVDPQYEKSGFFTEKSDIYSLGVVLFEILHGKLLVPTKDYDQQGVASILAQIHGKRELGWIVFSGIEKQIDPESLSTFRVLVSQCLARERDERPTAKEVLQQLEKSLEFQEEYEIWGPKLPKDYEEILKWSKSPGISYSTEKKKNLYKFLNGILLQNDKVWFSLGSNGEGNEMISATTFSYRNRSPHDKWCIVSESRFGKVAKMLDISNLMIEIETKTQFLSLGTMYGVYLVFKFCNSKNVSRNPMYVDLKYTKGHGTVHLHSYFAQWRDDEWMMVQLYQFSTLKKEVSFMFLLESLSPYYCRDYGESIYVEGIEFRPLYGASFEETKKSKKIQQVLKSSSNLNELPAESEMILKGSINYDEYDEKLFSLSEVNGKKHLMLSAMAAVYNSSDSTLFNSKPSPNSRFEKSLELLPQLVLRFNCAVRSQMLSRDTNYNCYLVFKLSEKCHTLHGPVEVRDLLQNNKVASIVYFRSPRPWNFIQSTTWVPSSRKDGCMEVIIWELNSNHELENDHVLVNLKMVSYEGSLSGLIVCGLEFRPI